MGTQPPPQKGADPASPPKKKNFRPMSIVAKRLYGWIKVTIGMEVGYSPGDFVLDGDPALSPKRGRSPLPNFRQISTVPKRLDASRCHWYRGIASAQGTLCSMGTQPLPSLKRDGSPSNTTRLNGLRPTHAKYHLIHPAVWPQ